MPFLVPQGSREKHGGCECGEEGMEFSRGGGEGEWGEGDEQ